MTDHAPDTHQSVPATGPLALKSNLVLGPNAHDVARESVDDALMIVESYGPWGADLNDAHRRQIVLADEVVRLRGLYEMAVRGRAEMRSALRQERRAEELHEGCQMPMEQARELAAATACVWNASHCEDAEGILCAWARSLVLRRACADKTVAPRYGA